MCKYFEKRNLLKRKEYVEEHQVMHLKLQRVKYHPDHLRKQDDADYSSDRGWVSTLPSDDSANKLKHLLLAFARHWANIDTASLNLVEWQRGLPAASLNSSAYSSLKLSCTQSWLLYSVWLLDTNPPLITIWLLLESVPSLKIMNAEILLTQPSYREGSGALCSYLSCVLNCSPLIT